MAAWPSTVFNTNGTLCIQEDISRRALPALMTRSTVLKPGIQLPILPSVSSDPLFSCFTDYQVVLGIDRVCLVA